MKGYKAMLRDRLPLLVDLALKYCKAKTRWVDHVYDNFINIYVDKDSRYEATRIALGISKKNRNFQFDETILWDNLDDLDRTYWKTISDWVNWFTVMYSYVENEYMILKYKHGHDVVVKILCDRYNLDNLLVEYLIKCFSKNDV